MLIRDSRILVQQPTQVLPARIGLPATQGLVSAISFADGSGPPMDSVYGTTWTLGSTVSGLPTWTRTGGGNGLYFSASGRQFIKGPVLGSTSSLGTSAWSVAYLWQSTESTGDKFFMGCQSSSTNNTIEHYYTGTAIYINFNDASTTNWNYGSNDPTLPHVYVITTDGASHTLYIDGQSKGTNSTAAKTFNWASTNTQFGLYPNGTGAVDGYLSLVAIWNRKLTPAEAVAIGKNPWQIFRASGGQWQFAAAAAAVAGLVPVPYIVGQQFHPYYYEE